LPGIFRNTACHPDLIVLDGVEAFVNGGPDHGKLVNASVILAGTMVWQ
jgi:uncharacterized protein (DUF362 family)